MNGMVALILMVTMISIRISLKDQHHLVEVVLVLLLLLLGDALDQMGGGVVWWRQLNTLA